MTRLQTLARSRRLILVAVGLLLVAIGALLLAGRLPAVRARAHTWAEEALARHLGREVRAERVEVQLLQARLALLNVRVARQGSLAYGIALEVNAIRLRWSWTAPLRRALVLNDLTLVRPRLSLRPAESAGTVSFFASDQAAMITGQALAADGGMLAGSGEDLRAVVRNRMAAMKAEGKH